MFAFYLVFGVGLIVWKDLPLGIQPTYRILLGVLLIVYGVFRFVRLINQKEED
jgi:hypothetical protein